MVRRLIVVLLLTALVPAAVALAATRGASSPTRAARLHYRNVALGKFRAAWDLLTPAAKQQLGPFDKWKKGYSQTGQVGLSNLKRSGRIVSFTLTACRGDDAREVTILETFSVTWPTKRISGRWFLDRGFKVRRTSKSEVDRCQLPLP